MGLFKPLLARASRAIKEQTHYGAWGAIEEYVADNGATTLGYTSLLGRGYTGHEHFTSVGLIHMNGRMYDSKLGRFLSPDNFIQDPFNTQSFNKFGYVWNNPLKYNDPSGEIIEWIILGAVVGGYLGGAAANGDFNPGNWEWNTGTFIAIGFGAILGAVGAYAIASPGGATLVVTGGVNAGKAGFLKLGSITITKSGASIASALGQVAYVSFASSKTKRDQKQQERVSMSGNESIGATSVELGSSNESTNSQDDAVIDSDDVIQAFAPLPMFTEPTYFNDVRDAYDFMQSKSFDHGVEVSAWELENGGALVLPYHRNDHTTSHNNFDKVHNPVKLLKGREYISYNGEHYKLSAQVHTHPFGGNGINGGFSGADRNLANWLNKPVKVIHHNQILEHRPGMGVDRNGYIKVNNLGRWR